MPAAPPGTVPGPFGVPISPDALAYVPADHAEREQTYQAHAGQAEAWPVALTLCGEPAPRCWGVR